MIRFAANLTFLFTDLPFDQRFAAARTAGFDGVEYMGAYDHDPAVIARCLRENDLELALFNTPTGDWAAGERGLACLPGREAEFRDGVDRALEHAAATGCKRVHVMAGVVPSGVDWDTAERCYIDNVRFAAEKLDAAGLTATIEPINDIDMPGYFLNGVEQARELMLRINHPAVKLQFDLYHAQIMGGNLATRLIENMSVVAHIQIAGNPGRHEPDVGEINYPYLFDLLVKQGYDGWVGCEYKPRNGTERGLGWMTAARARAWIL